MPTYEERKRTALNNGLSSQDEAVHEFLERVWSEAELLQSDVYGDQFLGALLEDLQSRTVAIVMVLLIKDSHFRILPETEVDTPERLIDSDSPSIIID